MKGSISEFELGVLRARMLDAIRAKARRGELRISVPIGYIWHREMGLGFDPDLRIQQVIRVIFARFRELGSARQVLLSMVAERIHFSIAADRSSVLVVVTLPGCDAGRLQQQAGQSCEHCAVFKGTHTVPVGTAKSRRP